LGAFEKKVCQLILDPAGIKKLSDTVLPNLRGSPQKIRTAFQPISLLSTLYLAYIPVDTGTVGRLGDFSPLG
jgi:hypothetical protein